MKKYDSYIICATPRSGSTLLCDLMTETGISGRPNSFFLSETISYWADTLHVPSKQWAAREAFDLNYLSAVKAYGANNTPLFGLRLMWESVNDLSTRLDAFYPNLQKDRDRFCAAFGRPLYIYLTREDKVSQAISRYRAEKSGLWHKYADGSERQRVKSGSEPTYDGHAIAKILTTLEQHNSAWIAWFQHQGIDPLPVSYETLSENPQSVVASVLSALDLDTAVSKTIKPKSAKMRNALSEAWAERFRREQLGVEAI